MNALSFKITLLEPLLVTQLGSGDENSAESLNYIPGSLLRNALAARYIAEHNLGGEGANDSACRALFFDEKVFVLNSYRADRRGERSLPMPLSWFVKKNDLAQWSEGATELALYDAAVEEAVFHSNEEPKPFAQNGGYCYLHEADGETRVVEQVNPTRQVSVHISREHKRALSKPDTNVFTYEALAADQVFCGAILAQDQEALRVFEQMLQAMPEFSIGGSRSAGYGRIRIEVTGIVVNYSETRESENEEGTVIVTLLSDAIVRDKWGQFSDDIGALLGASALRCYRKLKPAGGFNRKWGLPLPQAHAIQAGSVFVYADNAEIRQRLATFVAEGIGERRQDGFGRIAVNWNTARELQARRIEEKEEPQRLKATDPVSTKLAQRIVDARVRQEMERTLQRRLSERVFSGGSKATLARVRFAARQSMFAKSLGPLETLLKGIQGKKAEQTLRACHSGSDNLYDWLQACVKNGKAKNELVPDLARVPSIDGVTPALSDVLQIEFTARLIEGVARRAQKEAKRG